MRVVTEATLHRHIVCGTCWADENAAPGSSCSCREVDVLVEVSGEVGLPRLLQPITILTVTELETCRVWGVLELERMEDADREELEEALAWKDQQRRASEATQAVDEIGELMRTHVRLAVETGTDPTLVNRYLGVVRKAVLTAPKKEAA